MMFGMAAASSALDLIRTLTSSPSQSKTASKANFNVGSQTDATATFSGSSASSSLISADTMNALFQAQTENTFASTRDSALKSLFKTIDVDGSGQVSKSEFGSALGAGGTNIANADSVFGKMDADGDNNLSLDEMASALKPKKPKENKPDGNIETLLQMLDSMNAASADSNALFARTAASAASGASRAYTSIEQMFQRQADLTIKKAGAKPSLSVSV